MFATYVLFSEKLKKRYVGSSKNPHDRLHQHNQGHTPFTSRGTPWVIKYVEFYSTRSEAMARERLLKSGAGRTFLNFVFAGKPGYPQKELPAHCIRYELADSDK